MPFFNPLLLNQGSRNI